MTKIDALRRFLLPCLHHTADDSVSPPPTKVKRRLSASLRDDPDDDDDDDHHNYNKHRANPKNPQGGQETSSSSASSSPTMTAPPRPSRTMVIGTIFGQRQSRKVWFCIQNDRLASKPALLLELSIPIATLIKEMRCGLVRIALEFNAGEPGESGLSNCPLRSIPLWTLFCNGRKLGSAIRRKATKQHKTLLNTMQNITVGAGVIPSGPGFGSGSGSKELLYMRANYEYVVGSVDSESFHLINPEEGPSQELSVFLMRLR